MIIPRLIGCAAVAVLVQVHSLRAEIVHFTNPAPGEPGHYDWHVTIALGQVTESWLDLTISPESQSNQVNGNSVGQIGSIDPPHYHPLNQTYGGASVAFSQFFILTSSLDWGQDLGQLTYQNSTIHVINYFGSIFTSFPEGQRRYIGVLTANGNYGWIEVVRTNFNLTAYSWAYETKPGVPINAGQIPAPGSLLVLVVAVLRASTRHRRTSKPEMAMA